MAAPPAKKAKVGDDEKPEAKEVDQNEELEKDAPDSKKPTISDVKFFPKDTTLNVLSSTFGGLLKQYSEGGMQYLLAGARANVGVTSGRYMYEVKIVEFPRQPAEMKHKGVLRLGFSTRGGDLLLSEGEDSMFFDSEGFLSSGGTRTKLTAKWSVENVLAIVLNVDKGSPNYNTLSLFKDGVRMCQPQKMPDALVGQTLYPAVTFRNVTPHVNFGPEPLAQLPFKCHMIDGAAKADVAVESAPEVPKDGRYEVVYPVGIPEEGPFDWLDLFLKKNPKYTELSNRSLAAWARKSGLHPSGGKQVSRDQPPFSFGIPALDDGSIKRILNVAVAAQSRDFVVMELKGNLIREEREKLLSLFPKYAFKKVACVVMGEPTADFKKHTLEVTLKEKQAKADLVFKAQQKKKQLERKAAMKLKAIEAAKKKLEQAAEAERKKQAQEAEEAKEEPAKPDEAGEGAEAEASTKEDNEEQKVEDVEMGSKEPQEEEKAEEEPEVVEESPQVELTDEEKQLTFIQSAMKDMLPTTLSSCFSQFSVPDKAEGFDEMRYEWNKGSKCEEYLKQWTIGMKLKTRVEDLKPSPWFRSKFGLFERTLREWRDKQTSYKAAAANKTKQTIQQAADAASQKQESKKDAEQQESKEDSATEEKKDEQEATDSNAQQKPEETVDIENLDVFGVEDVCDVGGGMPLFSDFKAEDWMMAGLRYELSLLPHAFRHDVNDAERTGILVENVPYYYTKYYKKRLAPKDFGVETIEEIFQFVNDTVYIGADNVMESLLPAELEDFDVIAKITEESRRERVMLLATGDDSMQLKLNLNRNDQRHNPDDNGSRGESKASYGGSSWYSGSKGGKGARGVGKGGGYGSKGGGSKGDPNDGRKGRAKGSINARFAGGGKGARLWGGRPMSKATMVAPAMSKSASTAMSKSMGAPMSKARAPLPAAAGMPPPPPGSAAAKGAGGRPFSKQWAVADGGSYAKKGGKGEGGKSGKAKGGKGFRSKGSHKGKAGVKGKFGKKGGTAQ